MTYRVGLVGAGFIGRPLAGAFADTDWFAVVAAADPDSAARSAASDELSLPLGCCYENYRDMVDDENLDAVLVATPPAVREPVISTAVGAGLDVFCEKPLAVDTETARRIDTLVSESNIEFALGYQRRLHPGYQRIRRVVKTSGDPPRLVSGLISLDWVSGLEDTWKMDPTVPGSGFFADTVTHLIDTALWVANVIPTSVTATLVADGYEVDTHGTVTIKGRGGELITLSFDGQTSYTNETLRVVGSDTACCLTRPDWLSSGDMYGQFADETYDLSLHPTPEDEPTDLSPSKPAAFHCALKGEETPLATATDGLRETMVREAAIAASESNNSVLIE